jgi:energy-coupling factor transport system substrate-specific component
MTTIKPGSPAGAPGQKTESWLSNILMAVANLVGLAAFLYPFFYGSREPSAMQELAHAQDAPLVFIVLLVICLAVVIVSLESRRMDAKVVAILGVLIALNAAMRLVPGLAGFSLMFFLPIICGYLFGSVFGFLLGSLSILISAFITAGVGPWLPYQMFATGWMGLLSGWIPSLGRHQRLETWVLAVWGMVSGLLFGVIMNIWFWPYMMDPSNSGVYWHPGLSALESMVRYLAFYVVTSLWWDVGRAVGNFVLILALAQPILKIFRRYQQRFQFYLS